MLNKIIYILIFSILSLSFTGCFDRREIDDLVYPIAMGIDKGKTNNIKMTLQIPQPLAIGGEGSSADDKKVSLSTVEAPSIFAGLNMINAFVSKEVNMSHVKAVVISEEYAKEGMQIMNALVRGKEFRPNASILITKDTAEEYLKAVKPTFENNPAKYYELVLKAYKYTGFSASTNLIDFYRRMHTNSIQPVAILTAVNKYKKSDEFNLDNSTFKAKKRNKPFEGDYFAGEIPNIGDTKVEIMGLAVFDGQKMVGELDGEGATSYLMVQGEYNHSYVTIPDPSVDNYIFLNVKQSRVPVKKVELIGDEPDIKVEVILEADILSIRSGINYEDPQKVALLEKKGEEFFKDAISRYLNKTSKEYGCDINGFGNIAKSKYLTWSEWEKVKWLQIYKNSKFDVKVDLKVRRPGLIIKSIPVVNREGAE